LPPDVAAPVQAGGYAEYQFTGLDGPEGPMDLDASAITVRLNPGAVQRLTFEMERYANQPDLGFPWSRR